jgi:hypothetical protein
VHLERRRRCLGRALLLPDSGIWQSGNMAL